MTEYLDLLRFGPAIVFFLLAFAALRRQRVLILTREGEPIGYWVFTLGFIAFGIASAILTYDDVLAAS